MDPRKFEAIPRYAIRQEKTQGRRFLQALRRALHSFAKDAADGDDPETVLSRMEVNLEGEIIAAKGQWPLVYAVHGFNLSQLWMGKAAYCLAVSEFKVSPASIQFGADELVANHLAPRVQEWIAATSKVETKSTANMLGRMYRKAMIGWEEDGERRSGTPRDLALWIESEGAAQLPARANMLARTMTNWGYNEGAQASYAAAGVAFNQWRAVLDDVTGEEDEALDGTMIPVGHNFVSAGDQFMDAGGSVHEAEFDVPHPPLHPNCRCTIVPIV